jgi:hypothetical protein
MSIGVCGLGSFLAGDKANASERMKHNALLFDELYLTNVRTTRPAEFPRIFINELEYLIERGIVQYSSETPNLLAALTKSTEGGKSDDAERTRLIADIAGGHTDSMEELCAFALRYLEDCAKAISNWAEVSQLGHDGKVTASPEDCLKVAAASFTLHGRASYIESVLLRALRQKDALCIDSFWTVPGGSNIDRAAESSDLYEIIVSGLLLPDKSVPWEDILAFRSEPDSQQQLRALRLWIAETAKGKLSYVQAVDKIEYLKQEYRAHMKGAGIRGRNGVLRTLVVGAAGVIEDIAKFKIKDLAEVPFKLLDARADLIEADRKAVGRELAYVVRAQDSFSHTR